MNKTQTKLLAKVRESVNGNESLSDEQVLEAIGKTRKWAEAEAAVVAALEALEDEGVAKTMSRTLNRYKPKYEKCTSYRGTASLNNGDDLAVALAGKTPEEVAAIAEKLCDLEPGSLVERYASLNPGQVRMNSGNRIRAAIKRGDVTTKQALAAC